MYDECIRALIFDEEEDYEEYIATATKNIQADSSDYASYNNRGVAYSEMGEIQSALSDFRTASNLAPYESSPLLNRTRILEDMGDLEGALALASEAIRVAPTNSTCYFVRRGLYQKFGDSVLAEEDRQCGNKCRLADGNEIIE